MVYQAGALEDRARAAWGFLVTRNDISTTCRIYSVTWRRLNEYIHDEEVLKYLADTRTESYENLVEYRDKKLNDIKTPDRELVLD